VLVDRTEPGARVSYPLVFRGYAAGNSTPQPPLLAEANYEEKPSPWVRRRTGPSALCHVQKWRQNDDILPYMRRCVSYMAVTAKDSTSRPHARKTVLDRRAEAGSRGRKAPGRTTTSHFD